MKSFVVLAFLLGGCGTDDPVVVSGTYTVGVTNRDNGCNFANWTVGAMNSGIAITVSQSADKVTADVTGGTGLYLDIAFGSSAFTGTVDGNTLDLKLEGTRVQQSGTCTYTYNGEIQATTNGDLLTGKINYVPATNGNSDCAAVSGCLSYQDFTGSRPPQ
ncbi:MAG TPA: hypothetical protein VGC41_15720 [Kofleriaceae bacterium]